MQVDFGRFVFDSCRTMELHMKSRKPHAGVHTRMQFVWKCKLEPVGTRTEAMGYDQEIMIWYVGYVFAWRLLRFSMLWVLEKGMFSTYPSRCSKAFAIFVPAKARSSADLGQFLSSDTVALKNFWNWTSGNVGSRLPTGDAYYTFIWYSCMVFARRWLRHLQILHAIIMSSCNWCNWVVPQEAQPA